MKGESYRRFRKGYPHHVYDKSNNGFIIFYSRNDLLFYLTLFDCLRRKHDIKVISFCPMPNHIHTLEEADSISSFTRFHHELKITFSKLYNRQHNRRGQLMIHHFGYAPKVVAKRIRDAIIYINNNPVVGHIVEDAMNYRWNLLSYYNNPHPFSEKLLLNKASRRLRRAISIVKYQYNNNLYLNYTLLDDIYSRLDPKESKQLTDFICFTYNCVDYKSLLEYYGNKMMNLELNIRANNGSEHDIPDDYENYANYKVMTNLCKDKGLNVTNCNFDSVDKRKFLNILNSNGFPSKQIYKFLHILKP